jgi:hypothetical protein
MAGRAEGDCGANLWECPCTLNDAAVALVATAITRDATSDIWAALEPASRTVPAATEKKHHYDDDEECRGVHVALPSVTRLIPYGLRLSGICAGVVVLTSFGTERVVVPFNASRLLN